MKLESLKFEKLNLQNLNTIKGGAPGDIYNENTPVSAGLPNGDNIDWTEMDGGTGCEVGNYEKKDGFGGGTCHLSVNLLNEGANLSNNSGSIINP
jgi:hypothetical protein